VVFVCVDDNEDDFLAEVYHGAFFWDLGTCGHMLMGKFPDFVVTRIPPKGVGRLRQGQLIGQEA